MAEALLRAARLVDIIPRANDGGGSGRRCTTASRRRRRRDGTPLVAGTAPMALHQQGEEVDTSQTFPPPAAVGNNDVVTGQRLSIVATSADHSAAAAASVGDNGDYDDEANKAVAASGDGRRWGRTAMTQ